MIGEFELIRRYFTREGKQGSAVLGIGDDCALLAPSPGHEIAISTDMLVEGRHFIAGTDAQRLGHKTLAVNLSDCAAVGARPRYALLAGALPDADPDWLSAFSRGLFALADRFDVELVGGDTTRGPRNLCVTIIGEVPSGEALLRSGARAGDVVWVSGVLGSAAAGLPLLHTQIGATAAFEIGATAGEIGATARLRTDAIAAVAPGAGPAGTPARVAAVRALSALSPAERAQAIDALERPEPRVALGQALRNIASSAIDVSDGLIGDLGHILARSHVGAEIDLLRVPVTTWMRALASDEKTRSFALNAMLAGGDDYELCFTAPPARERDVLAAGERAGVAVTAIGRIVAGGALIVRDDAGAPLPLAGIRAFDHFS